MKIKKFIIILLFILLFFDYSRAINYYHQQLQNSYYFGNNIENFGLKESKPGYFGPLSFNFTLEGDLYIYDYAKNNIKIFSETTK